MCSRILPAFFLQGSGVTALKCGEIHDMDFVANFTENVTVKNFENWSTFCQTINECIVAQFLSRQCIFVIEFRLSCAVLLSIRFL